MKIALVICLNALIFIANPSSAQEAAASSWKAASSLSPNPPAETKVNPAKASDEKKPEPEAAKPKPPQEPNTAKGEESEIERLLSGKISPAVSTSLEQFGYSLFRRDISTFAPVTDVPVGPDYIIGPGDSFSITLWGKAQAQYAAEVDRDGKITLPEVGTVSVWGLTFAELKNVLHTELSRYYPEFQLSITMQKLRTIRVYIVGKVQAPGGYSLSSLSTLINALFAAGGPAKSGSLRRIQLIRNGKLVKLLDLYDFLLKGDKSQDERLQPGDVVFVPMIGEVVGIAGDVKEPAIYEMKERLNIDDLIKLAGGVTPSGYLKRVQVERVVAHEKKIVADLNLSPTPDETEAGQLKTTLQDRDMVKIYPIKTEIQNMVSLEGHVLRPDNYELKAGMRLSDLITSYNDLLPEPCLDYAEIIRKEEPDFHERIIPFNLGEVLKKNPKADLPLQRFDRIAVYSKWHFKDSYQVSIEGEVRHPVKTGWLEDMRVSDLIKRAGGVTREAYLGKAQIFRLTPKREIETVYFDLGKAIEGDKTENILLQDEDRVVIHNIWESKWKDMVYVAGEVNKPGEYRLTQDMRVSDLIFQAGNFKDNAYLKEAEISRLLINQDGLKTELIKIDLERALRGDPKNNIPLQKYDSLSVRTIPDWKEKRLVTLRGEVRLPGTYSIGKEERLSSLIQRAGGYSDQAYLRGAVFTRESVKAVHQNQLDELIRRQEIGIQTISAQIAGGAMNKDDAAAAQQTLAIQKELLDKLKATKVTGRIVINLASLDKLAGSEYDIKLKDGDDLYIPLQPDTVAVLGEVYNPTTVLYRENKAVEYYLNKVGGTTKDADGDEIYLVKADGSVISRSQKSGLFMSWDGENNRWISGGFMSTKLEPGDTILVPRNLEKIQWLKSTSEVTQILYQMAIAIGVAHLLF